MRLKINIRSKKKSLAKRRKRGKLYGKQKKNQVGVLEIVLVDNAGLLILKLKIRIDKERTSLP